ncbi:sensor histidine kinase [Brevibacillus laterosporus]|uniref:sensor histidine kinase n=1 Tax=Brevibacillus laterosporus TaxID=1465 RepID=UPI00265697E4|nr:sensor histidine kinase [Brevibacillus laterosporus]MDN9009627.1 sensor histidine kinase [Brevibacillus laterosporus]MDO0940374.1 sensor histidine kinase [Brevibacillus laterosporus]
MEGLSVAVFFRDRLVYMFLCVLIVGLGVGFMLLEKKSYPDLIDMGTIYYFVMLALFFILLWMIVDYIRQKGYYKQIGIAIERADELQAVAIVQSMATREQRLVARLLEKQHNAYLNELGKYRRQQELHNHFVLQWVHQMKTPVSIIDLLAQEALQEMPSTKEGQKKLVVSMQEEAERMTRGLEMMLYTARLDKFEIDLHIKKIPLHELIRTVINAHKRLCIRYSIFPQIDGELWVETDEKWMMVVLNQFVSNAIKYSKSKLGEKRLVFHLESNMDKGSKLSITDEGAGIAPHDMPRIFDPFFTGENGRIAGESTGMGLYIAKQVCNRLGHGLLVESELSVGTTFTVTFEPRGIHILSER